MHLCFAMPDMAALIVPNIANVLIEPDNLKS